jgi:hypothetical protein
VTRPRAADDFAMIRARMEELRRERARPRAADDFPMIRARMDELRRARPGIPFETVPLSPKPSRTALGPTWDERRLHRVGARVRWSSGPVPEATLGMPPPPAICLYRPYPPCGPYPYEEP